MLGDPKPRKSDAQGVSPLGSARQSYWAATENPYRIYPTLAGHIQVDVAVIGAGFTGLSAAYHLVKHDVDVTLLDAMTPGWGASGRNGGMLPPRYKKGFAGIAKSFGHEVTRRLHRIVHEAVDTVETIVDDCGISCGFRRYGQLTSAHSQSCLADLDADIAWARREAGDNTVRRLSGSEVRSEIGGGFQLGGWLDPRGAGINPLNYALGLAGSLSDRGVRICGNSPVLRILEEADGVRLETPAGTVSARQVIIATNAYTDMHGQMPGDLGRRIVPVNSSVIVTAPLESQLRSAILPGRRMVADTKLLMNWYRILDDGRLMFGGRGDITGRRDDDRSYRMLERRLAETFPALGGIGIDYRWSGKVAVSLDDFPHVGRLSPKVLYALGYGGRGVALSNVLGKYLADLVRGQDVDLGPMSAAKPEIVPFHRFRIKGMQMVALWYQFRDYINKSPISQ